MTASPHEVCVSENFAHYLPLSRADEVLLNKLEEAPRHVSRGRVIWKSKDRPDNLYTLRCGWACSIHRSESGEEQTLDVFLPGDLLGIRELTFPSHPTTVMMLTDGIICPFPTERLMQIFQESPTLTLAVHASAARQQAVITERLVNILRHDARARIAHFVLEIYYRLRRVDPTLDQNFSVPLSQADFSKLLGMTTVHVSRTLNQMEKQGLLRKSRKEIQIQDLDRLHEIASFDPETLTDQINPALQDSPDTLHNARKSTAGSKPRPD